MITRSKLVEQLREYQIRSHQKWPIIHSFSPKPQITSRYDVVVALSFGLLFCLLMLSSCAALYYKYFKLSAFILLLGILVNACLTVSRKRKLAKRRERRMMLPLSMWILSSVENFNLIMLCSVYIEILSGTYSRSLEEMNTSYKIEIGNCSRKHGHGGSICFFYVVLV